MGTSNLELSPRDLLLRRKKARILFTWRERIWYRIMCTAVQKRVFVCPNLGDITQRKYLEGAGSLCRNWVSVLRWTLTLPLSISFLVLKAVRDGTHPVKLRDEKIPSRSVPCPVPQFRNRKKSVPSRWWHYSFHISIISRSLCPLNQSYPLLFLTL
jgi:hypothetical protein